MRFSQLLLPTLKEDPAEAEVISHKLLLRAGFIRKLTAGVYSYLPLGLAAIRKVERIVREEMNQAGAQELLLPMVQPADLWQESGRWEKYGPELLRFKDRHQRESCLGPTHEEVITDLVRMNVHSYRDLPLNLYQVQTKFRDEIRPRFGLMRGREFTMKDAYSFDADDAAADESYRTMVDAYVRIFQRCGLEFVSVEADSGAIGGRFSHEFMVLAESGEDAVAACRSCGYGANVERAEVRPPEPPKALEVGPLERVETPDQRTIEEVSAFLGLPASAVAKTLIFETDAGTVAVCVRGDHDANPAKVKNLLGANGAELAGEAVVTRLTGAPLGFAGPVGLSVPVYMDHALRGSGGVVVGANQAGAHYRNALPGRDFPVAGWADLRTLRDGDPCPRCGESIAVKRGIEVGHVFKLGTKYSESLRATFLDDQGAERPLVMGCYGIGVGRTAAAAIEQNHDSDGIVWPVPLAPWEVVLLPLQVKDDGARRVTADLARELEGRGIEVLVDDRDERPGVKFKDADLLGIPLRLTVGPKGLAQGVVEARERKTRADHRVSVDETAAWAAAWVRERRT